MIARIIIRERGEIFSNVLAVITKSVFLRYILLTFSNADTCFFDFTHPDVFVGLESKGRKVAL